MEKRRNDENFFVWILLGSTVLGVVVSCADPSLRFLFFLSWSVTLAFTLIFKFFEAAVSSFFFVTAYAFGGLIWQYLKPTYQSGQGLILNLAYAILSGVVGLVVGIILKKAIDKTQNLFKVLWR